MTHTFTRLPTVPGVTLRVLSGADATALDALSVECADFVRMVERRAPAVGDGLETLRAAPAGLSLNDKLMIGIDSGPMLIGVVDLLRNFPSRDAWYIGLMLLTPSRRAGGLGSAVYAALADWVRGQGGKTIRLVVQFENVAGLRFWIRQGFAEIGSATQDLGTHINQVRRMECRL